MKTFKQIAWVIVLSLHFSWALDEITLKNGEILKGKLDDKRETATEVYIDISTSKGISDYKAVLKSDIEATKKSDGAEDPAVQLELPAESTDIKWYEEQTEKVLKPWIAKYPQSPLFPQLQQKLTDFEAEKGRVKSGDIKLSGKWYSRTEFEEVRIDIEALKFLADLQEMVGRKDYSGLLKAKVKLATYRTSENFDKICEEFLLGFKDFQSGGYEELIRKQIADLEYKMSQNEKWIRETINQPIPATSFGNDDVMEWESLRSSGPASALKKRQGSTSSATDTNAYFDESKYYVRFGGEYYRMTDVMAEWNKSDSAVNEFITDFKKFYADPNAPKLRISSAKMAETRRLLAGMEEAKEKVKTVKKESESIGQFEDRIAKTVTEVEGVHIENFGRAKEAVKAALLAHEQRDFNVTASELRSGSQAWPGLISIDRAVKQIASDYFKDSKTSVEKGEIDKAMQNLTSANQIIPLAKAKFISLVTLKTEINKFMAENKQLVESMKKQEAEEKKKEQDQKAFFGKFESDFNRGDYVAISKMNPDIMQGSDQYQSVVDRKKLAEDNMAQAKELMKEMRPLIQQKRLAEASENLAKMKGLWPLNPGTMELSGLLAEAMKPKTFLDSMEEHMMISIIGFGVVFLGIAYGVAKYLSK